MRSAGRHAEDRVHGRVVEIAKPRERAEFHHVELPFGREDIVADVHPDDAADYHVVNLVEGVRRQSQPDLQQVKFAGNNLRLNARRNKRHLCAVIEMHPAKLDVEVTPADVKRLRQLERENG